MFPSLINSSYIQEDFVSKSVKSAVLAVTLHSSCITQMSSLEIGKLVLLVVNSGLKCRFHIKRFLAGQHCFALLMASSGNGHVKYCSA